MTLVFYLYLFYSSGQPRAVCNDGKDQDVHLQGPGPRSKLITSSPW